MSGVTGIDTSHWSGVPTQEQVDCVWDMGYRFWIVGLQLPSVFIPTIRRLELDGRFRIEGYEYLYQSQGAEKMVRDSIGQLQDARLIGAVKRFWLDYESGGELPGDAEVPQILHLVNLCESYGLQAGWYSGIWWTATNISNVTPLVEIPFWLANYDGRPDASGGTFHTKQYKGDTKVCGGMAVDLNWRSDAVWQAESEDELDAEGLIALVGKMNADQKNRFYKGLKDVQLDLVNPPADAPKPLTWAAWDHYVKDKLGADTGGGRPAPPAPLPDGEYETTGVMRITRVKGEE